MSAYLFSLVPQNNEARTVIRHPHNKAYYELRPNDAEAMLSFRIDKPSKLQGYLASFGRHEENDIMLPRDTSGNYSNFHMYFWLAPQSGELMVRDLTRCRTSIEVKNVPHEDQFRYDFAGEIRARVIPRDPTLEIHLSLGGLAVFKLVWRCDPNHHADQRLLTEKADTLLTSQMRITLPASKTHFGEETFVMVPKTDRKLRSAYAPDVKASSNRLWPTHRYTYLGAGGYGVVSKVVDLSNGKLWALKEIKPDTPEMHKLSMKQEVDVMSRLKHPNIVRLKHFQDFQINGRFQLFFKLCEGNLAQLMPNPGSHSCLLPPSDKAPTWTLKMIRHISSALEYLHTQNLIHRDIKPENILYEYKDKDYDGLPHFYVADFGMAATVGQTRENPNGGTFAYMPPEPPIRYTTQSDMWAFGVTLGEVLGYWCRNEIYWSLNDGLRQKFINYGVPVPEEPAQNSAPNFADLQSRWHGHLLNMRNVLPRALGDLLCLDPAGRMLANHCAEATKDDAQFLGQRQLQTVPAEDLVSRFKKLFTRKKK